MKIEIVARLAGGRPAAAEVWFYLDVIPFVQVCFEVSFRLCFHFLVPPEASQQIVTVSTFLGASWATWQACLLPQFSLQALHSFFVGEKTGSDFLRDGPLHTNFKSSGGSIPKTQFSPKPGVNKVSSENWGT